MLAREGIAKFPKGTALYIRPMSWAESGFVDVDPETTRWSMSVYESPMPESLGFSGHLARLFAARRLSMRRPTPRPPAIIPIPARAIREARERGFDNAVMLDGLGHVSELTTANIMMVKDGEVHTPVPNGTFLVGITRNRVVELLRRIGILVHERALRWQEFLDADEVFSTGNFGKVVPITRIEDRDLQPGPVFARARELYWAFAHGEKI